MLVRIEIAQNIVLASRAWLKRYLKDGSRVRECLQSLINGSIYVQGDKRCAGPFLLWGERRTLPSGDKLSVLPPPPPPSPPPPPPPLSLACIAFSPLFLSIPELSNDDSGGFQGWLCSYSGSFIGAFSSSVQKQREGSFY